ncbi:MAG: HlyD family efflux transporter periplasmic adaptor subunit [Sulfurimonas sp.]|nr:HlyD family efflux transporter periplasmic adaptor subunit [Sulfurimonas sp.]
MNKLFLFLLMMKSLLLASSIEVSVVTPVQNSDTIKIEADGLVISKNITLTAKTSGIIHRYVNDNVNVAKGELLAKVDDKRRHMKLNYLKERLKFLDNQLIFEKDRVQEIQEKYKMGIAPKNEFLNEKIILEQFQESKKSTLSDYKILQLEEKESVVIAKEDGFITQLSNENKFVNYGDSLGILTPKDVEVKLFVDSKYANNIQEGMNVNMQSSYGKMTGTVRGVLAQTSSNLLEVMVASNSILPVNLQLKAEINIQNIKGLKIPKSAIVLVDNQPAVYEIRDGIVHLKFIEILSDRVDFALIKNTLSKDAKIALKNTYMLHDNLEVIVK